MVAAVASPENTKIDCYSHTRVPLQAEEIRCMKPWENYSHDVYHPVWKDTWGVQGINKVTKQRYLRRLKAAGG